MLECSPFRVTAVRGDFSIRGALVEVSNARRKRTDPSTLSLMAWVILPPR